MEWRLFCDDLSHRIGPIVLLRRLNVVFPGGHIHVIRGANGVGKTTLFRLLTGRVRPWRGSVSLSRDGESCARLPELSSWLGHSTGLYGDLSVRENLELHARLLGLSDYASAAERWGLGRLLAVRAGRLSRGQQQRVALALPFCSLRPVLALDEPSTGLDGEALDVLVSSLVQSRQQGRIVMVISHDEILFERLRNQSTEWRLHAGTLIAAN